MEIEQLPTPALLVDLPVLEDNLRTMQKFFGSCSAKLRPHFKNHRVLTLADRQLAAGACGVTCARLWQAELLVKHGVFDVLIANEIAGPDQIRRFVELSRQAPVVVAVDSTEVVEQMATAGGSERGNLNVVVDIDVGLNRCGVADCQAALTLAKKVVACGLRFRGIMGYEGHLQMLVPGPEKDRTVRDALQKLVRAKKCIEEAEIPVEIISCGGTGDYSIVASIPGVTEVQAGSFMLMDRGYESIARDFRPTLTVLCTVLSMTPGKRIVVDAGVKAISAERGVPSLSGFDDLCVKAIHAEHAIIEDLDSRLPFKLGEKLQLRVQYHDGTIQLHKQMFGMRNGVVEETFRIEHGV
jgi:D-serine deaminase-like pyridoxal phosphate-dependent protein